MLGARVSLIDVSTGFDEGSGGLVSLECSRVDVANEMLMVDRAISTSV